MLSCHFFLGLSNKILYPCAFLVYPIRVIFYNRYKVRSFTTITLLYVVIVFIFVDVVTVTEGELVKRSGIMNN
jgi:uncharacterized membrane protein